MEFFALLLIGSAHVIAGSYVVASIWTSKHLKRFSALWTAGVVIAALNFIMAAVWFKDLV